MTGCHGCQELLLDHLYDLLDGAEGQRIKASLDAMFSVLRKLAGHSSRHER